MFWAALAGLMATQHAEGQENAVPELPALEARIAPRALPPATVPPHRPVVPEGLPRYEIDARLDLDGKRVTVRQSVRFTNSTSRPLAEAVFHVYPRYKVPESDKLVLSKTLEVLRLSPEEAMDTEGRRMDIAAARVAGRPAAHTFDAKDDTILVVPLQEPLAPGAEVVIDVDYSVVLNPKWGRWGHHDDITYLMNWYPVLAHLDDAGWERTPFLPWHQPWHQSAAHYRVSFDLPEDEMVASSGRIVETAPSGPGRKRIVMVAEPARDFAFVSSRRFEAIEADAGSTRVRVLAFPEDRANADRVLEFAREVIPLYESWFGPYFDDEFELAASYFGWNGNECSGLVLLDERVMRLPAAGERYIDHLVTHETLHQWFWCVVGTNGFAEPFMDEGLVNSLTAYRLDRKYGRNAPLIVWPDALGWLPTIGREDLRLAGYYNWRAKGNTGPVIQDLKAMGNLNTLFSLAYDRGGKVVEMIRNRLGDERFFEFLRRLYSTYAWKTLRYADFERELIAFDASHDWKRFLEHWLIDHGETDWSVDHVRVGAVDAAKGTREVIVDLRQAGAIDEPTILALRSGESEIRVPIWPDRGDYAVPGARVDRDGDVWKVAFDAPDRPSQVEVDPDHALLDARPDNNRWKPEISWRLTPIVTPLDESSQFQSYDRISVTAGPFIDAYTRGGLKVAAQRLERWRISGWAGVEPSIRQLLFGGQAELLHFPGPMWSSGIFYEEGLYNFYDDLRHSGGRIFTRFKFLETSSVLIDDPGFVEFYYGFGNEFWAGDDGRPVNGTLAAVGARFRLSTLFPYWDPVSGRFIEATAEYGDPAIGSVRQYVRMTGEYGIVRALPEWTGPLHDTRIALRAFGGVAFPDESPYLRLGGGRRNRAIGLGEFLGSSVWLGTIEWRFPLWKNADQEMLDHVVGLRNIQGTVFYDVGQSYLRGEWSDVVHGVGGGLRFDVSLFQFLERASLRVDLAQPVGLGSGRGPVLWFGLNQIF
ncbi:MAG: M1 family aminopeptidase [Isosphaeraceae bacterium]|nr:M1 family aminopeptidase [Isosphaeraceae bacterium]